MAVGVSFFLVYSKKKIFVEKLGEYPISIRAQVRYTRSHLNWSSAKRVGHTFYRVQFTTPVKVQPRWWANGKVKHNHPGAGWINATLDSIAQRAVSLHSQYIADGAFPEDEQYIAEMLGARETAGPESTFFQRYEAYVSYLADKGVTRSTQNRNTAIIGHLRKFQAKTGYVVDFASINKTFSAKFSAWCVQNLQKQRQSQDIAGATVPRYLKDLRNFLTHALSEGWTTTTTWKQVKHTIRPKGLPITITDVEIQALWALREDDLDGGKRMARAAIITRDWFLLGTQTALRWSDWRKQEFEFVSAPSGHNLQFRQKKTDAPLEIPLSDLALKILKKHDWKMPAVYTPASTMAHLTILAAAAGIQKHITSHTARRTFCTLQEAAGVPRGVIMRITGHQTEKDYLRYTGITYKVNAELMRRANPEMFVGSAG